MPNHRGQTRLPRETATRRFLESPLVAGIIGLGGLVTALADDNPWVRGPAIAVILTILLVYRLAIWIWLQSVSSWLTWKFAFGFTVGILGGAVASPTLFQPLFNSVLFVVSPHVELLDSVPANGVGISFNSSTIYINFSETIPLPYRWFVDVEIAPEIPFQYGWTSFDPVLSQYSDYRDECCHRLYITPSKYFPGQSLPAFEPSTTYHVTVKGPFLRAPIYTEFHTQTQ